MIAVLGVREAAAMGRWFSEKPVLDQANLGKHGDSDDEESKKSERSHCTVVPYEDTVEYWIYQWFALRYETASRPVVTTVILTFFIGGRRNLISVEIYQMCRTLLSEMPRSILS